MQNRHDDDPEGEVVDYAWGRLLSDDEWALVEALWPMEDHCQRRIARWKAAEAQGVTREYLNRPDATREDAAREMALDRVCVGGRWAPGWRPLCPWCKELMDAAEALRRMLAA